LEHRENQVNPTSSFLVPLRLPTPFAVGPVNVYLLEGPELTLVDVGPDTAEALTALEAGLAAHGHALTELRHIVITHAHPDHYGLAARLAALSGARIYCHPLSRRVIAAAPAELTQRYAWYGEWLRQAGLPEPIQAQLLELFRSLEGQRGVPADRLVELNDGDRLPWGDREWQALHTPGHAQGHLCFYHRPSGALLAGDHLLRGITPNPGVEPPWPGSSERPRSLIQYFQSLERLTALNITTVWPGHGEPLYDYQAHCEELSAFHHRRADEIAALLDGESQTVYQLTQRFFPQLQRLDLFLGLSEVIAHLDLLEAAGRVSVSAADGVLRYQLTDEPHSAT